ncbi:hypothetical protein [Nocardia grenadensis]
MARDLPFDGDEEVTERGGDTAYRIASATSRVARGGAYVTGGALIANNGGGVPAPPSELDSRNAGWAYSADPDPDVPSPVVTFPDPEPVLPAAPGSAGDASTTMPLPHGSTFDIQVGRPGDFDLDDYYPGVHTEDIPGLTLVPGAPEGGVPGSEFMPGTGVPESKIPGMPEFGAQDPGLPPNNIPGFDGIPGWGQGFSLPGNEGFGAPGEFELPEPGDAFQTDIFDLPRFNLSPDSSAQSVARSADDGDWGFDLADLLARPAGDPASGWYGDSAGGPTGELIIDYGVDGGMVFADGFGHAVAIDSHMGLDISAGADGFWAASDWDLDITVGDGNLLDDRLDQYLDWAQSGAAASDALHSAGRDPLDAAARTNAGAETRGAEPGVAADAAVPGAASGTGAVSGTGAAVAPGVAAPGSIPAAAMAPGPGVPAPVAPAPVAPAPMAAAPVAPAPVAPAPVPPPVVAPAAMAPAVQPVAATPLQTTVQPDAATTPMANVLHAPAGPSPLTAPAAQLPDLFHRPPQAPTPDRQSPAEPTLPGSATPIVPTTTVPTTTGDATSTTGPTTTGPEGSTTTSPDGSTTVDGSTTPSIGGTTSTSPDGSTTSPETTTGTEGPTTGSTSPETATSEGGSTGSTGESTGVTTTSPGASTGETVTGGITTDPIGGTNPNGPGTGDPTPDGTPSTVDVPTQQVPTQQVPTADQPSAPVPTVSVPTQQPTLPDAPAPVTPHPLPTPLPVAPQVQPIADHISPVPYDVHAVAVTPYTEHTAFGIAGGGLTGDLSGGLLPHTVAVTEDPIADHGHWVIM